MNEPRISGYCQHNWLDLSKSCPDCEELKQGNRIRQLETALSVANAEVERLKEYHRWQMQMLELYKLMPEIENQYVDRLFVHVAERLKQRNALLANSKALAHALETDSDDGDLLESSKKALAAHNKLMEQFK